MSPSSSTPRSSPFRRLPSGSESPPEAPVSQARRSSAAPTRASCRSRCSSTRPPRTTGASWPRWSNCCRAACPREQSRGNKKAMPPLVVLHWGAITAFPAFVTQVSAKYTLFSPGGTPIRAVCTVALEEMPADPPGQNPTSGSRDVRSVHTMVAGDSLASVAYAEYGDPTMWRAIAEYNGIDDPLRTGAGTAVDPHPRRPVRCGGVTAGAHEQRIPRSRSTGALYPPTSRACCPRRTSRTAAPCPTCSSCASGTPTAPSSRRGSSTLARSSRSRCMTSATQVAQPLVQGEVTALEAEFDSGGTFTVVRGYDLAHRLFRGRRTETYTQTTVSDVVKKVAAGREDPARHRPVARRPCTTICRSAATSDWEFLSGLAAEIGYELAVRGGKLEFGPPQQAGTAPTASGRPGTDPLVLHVGTDLLRFRAVVTSSAQVKEVEVRGWDVAQKKALVATAPAETATAELAIGLARRLRQDVRRPGRGFRRRSVRVAIGGRRRRHRPRRAARRRLRGVRGSRTGQPRPGAPGTAFTVESIGEPWDGKYTITTSRHQYDPTTGYTTTVAVTGGQERSLYGLASGRAPRAAAPAGSSSARSATPPTRRSSGRVKVTLPVAVGHLRQRLVPHRAARRRRRPWLAGPPRGRRRGPGRVRARRCPAPVRRGRALQRRRQAEGGVRPGRRHRLGHRQPAVVRVAAAGTASTCSTRTARSEGISLVTGDDKLQLVMDATGTSVTVHSDGT